MGAKCFQIASMLFIFGSSAVFLAAFAGRAWLVGDKYEYGLWRMCETNTTGSENCQNLALAKQEGYFEACRTLATFALLFSVICIVACFVDENDSDTGLRKACYRYFFCVSTLILVALQILSIAVMGGNYKEDPRLKGQGVEPGWCVALTGMAAALAFLSCVCRFRVITAEQTSNPCCLDDCRDDRAKTGPSSHTELNISQDSTAIADAMRAQLPSSVIRRTSSANSDGLDGRIAHLPPLPLKPRGTLPRSSSLRSTDSGLDSKDVSRDSILDEMTGPLPLSVEMLRRHDRRLSGAAGRRTVDDRRRRPAFSSTTSLSTTDSQSSAELAPRVHTPTNLKRVHYDDIPKQRRPRPEEDGEAPATPGESQTPEEPGAGLGAGGGQAPPIISFPIKVQGVELSRAKTNARTSSTIDNLRSMSSALRKWRGATPETIVEEDRVGTESGTAAEEGTEESASSSKKKTKKKTTSKKKKSKRSSTKSHAAERE